MTHFASNGAAPPQKSGPPRRREEDSARFAHSVEELTQRNVETVSQLEASAQQQRSVGDRVSDAITGFCGSVAFVWVHVAWFGGWIAINTLLPKKLHFDPYPFQFMTFVVSLEAIFLSTFVLISQNRAARTADRRNHLDLQVNLLAEQENTKMMQMLESIARKVGADLAGDPTLKVFQEATRPEKLIEQIDASMNRTDEKTEANKI